MPKKQRDFLRIRHAKEYIDGVRKNPFFLKAPPKRWILMGVGALSATGIIAGAIWLTYLPFFRVTAISITGAATIAQDDLQKNIEQSIANYSYPMIARNNVYLMNTSAIEQSLMQNFSLETVEIQRTGTALEIKVKEKITTVAFRTKEKTIFLGLDGAYVRDATAEESHAIDVRIGTATATEGEILAPLQTDMPVILDTQNDPATSLSIEHVTHVLDIVIELKQRGIIVKTFTFDGATALFTRVDTNQSYDLFFDLHRSVTDQVDALAALVAAPNFSPPSEYIDLRFGAYVYVK